ncbi:hypothetical protein BCR33DRAFT_720584, partial [Rhizoclosmatium globosum]
MKTNSLLVTLLLALSAQADVVSDASAILTSLPACSYGCVAQIPGFVANLNVEMITKVCSNWAADSPVFYNCMAKSGCAGTLSATTNTTVAKFQALCPQVLGTTATTVSALASASSSTYGGPVRQLLVLRFWQRARLHLQLQLHKRMEQWQICLKARLLYFLHYCY